MSLLFGTHDERHQSGGILPTFGTGFQQPAQRGSEVGPVQLVLEAPHPAHLQQQVQQTHREGLLVAGVGRLHLFQQIRDGVGVGGAQEVVWVGAALPAMEMGGTSARWERLARLRWVCFGGMLQGAI